MAENIMKYIVDYQNEENLVEMRWTNENAKIQKPG